MTLRIGRTLPPAVAPISLKGIGNGILAMFRGDVAKRNFNDQLKKHFKVKHCFLLSSGKASLTLILQALKELNPEKDEVLIPAFTCYSVPAAIVRAGLKIRLCDIEVETLDFDYRELTEQLASPRLLCVIPTHLFGLTADISRVREIIGSRNIAVIEDAAQTMGGERKGRKAGTLGDVGFFSLGRGKALSTVEGGIILTNSDIIGSALCRKLDVTPEYSISEQLVLALYAAALSVLSRPWLFWIPKMLPFLGLGETLFDPHFSIKRMSAFQAGLAVRWEERLFGLMNIRKKNAAYLLKASAKSPIGTEALLSGPVRFPIIVSDSAKKRIILHVSNHLGLGGADVYPDTIDGIAELGGCIVAGTSTKACSIVERLITFPVHPYVTEADMEKIADLIRESRGNVMSAAESMQNAGERNR